MEAKPVIKVAAVCGSLRKASFNRGLILSAIEICNESIRGMEVEFVDISGLPFINPDLENGSEFPEAVEEFRRKILEADCFLFASPEYNYSIPAPLKNALDWGSRPPNVWADKAAAIVSAAGGSGGSRVQFHLRQVGVFLNIHFINKPELYIFAHKPPKKFDSDGNLIHDETREYLKKILESLHSFAGRLGP
ncbi:uncharacterized protein A4U43_UnF8220 [Asparagus officinalis]|uniref:NAD(P)H dehydrogenase (quinone) n=1 Tax=Asparagus officinalis TaxID=4686 RepID=A0A1R3L612_ASPOF|nr:NAD(P)H:quinone oxidoreductase-like isoform X1 [Asparagus officinalis]ONK55045.1 uncharacterized protein A4U43_UnF8220 [Asparagus officinalis]